MHLMYLRQHVLLLDMREVLTSAGLPESTFGSDPGPGFTLKPVAGSYPVQVCWFCPDLDDTAQVHRTRETMLTAMGALLREEGYLFSWSVDLYERNCLEVSCGPERVDDQFERLRRERMASAAPARA